MGNWLVVGGYGVFAFLDPATTGIGFVLFFIAGCLHILVNIIFQKTDLLKLNSKLWTTLLSYQNKPWY